MKSILATRSLVVLAALLLTACASGKRHMRLYAGPERSSDEIAKLFIVESLEVSRINGKAIPTIPRVIRSGERRLDLLPGGYDVVLYYDEVWQVNSSNEDVVRSEAELVSLELAAGHTYRLGHRPPIDLEDARMFARNVRLTIVDLNSGQPVQLALESRPAVVNTPVVVSPIQTTETSAGLAPAMHEESTEAVSENDQGRVPVAPRIPEDAPKLTGKASGAGGVPIVASASAAEVSEPLSALELLKFWWQQASPEERAQFRDWVAE